MFVDMAIGFAIFVAVTYCFFRITNKTTRLAMKTEYYLVIYELWKLEQQLKERKLSFAILEEYQKQFKLKNQKSDIEIIDEKYK